MSSLSALAAGAPGVGGQTAAGCLGAAVLRGLLAMSVSRSLDMEYRGNHAASNGGNGGGTANNNSAAACGATKIPAIRTASCGVPVTNASLSPDQKLVRGKLKSKKRGKTQ